MATFYVDFENGNDANDGTTFANRWKTLTNGATAARIGPGDEIRMMGSPAPTSLGINATWTSGQQQAAKNITGATNATPISITCAGHGYSTGDTVVLTSVGGNTSANGVWEITVTGTDTFTLDGSVGNAAWTSGGTVKQINNAVVRLASPLTKEIASTGMRTTAWTASANVTTSLSTTTKEHYVSDSIAIGAAFTTGKAAYFATGALDLSGYQQISFWIYQDTGALGAAGSIDLRLCSDTTGNTAVNTINVPALSILPYWHVFTVDLGTNLGSNIQSIALYVNTDNGAQTFLLSNIIACKARSASDSLTLQSLIGKNVTGETFWPIQSIKGTRVLLDLSAASAPSAVVGYYGTSETCTTYKRETIKVGPAATALLTINDSGTEGNPITFTGGWDRTAMTTQNLQTWLDGVNGSTTTFTATSQNYFSVSNVAVNRFGGAHAIGSTCNFVSLTFIAATATGSISSPGPGTTIRVGHFIGSGFSTPVARSVKYVVDYLAGCTAIANVFTQSELNLSGGTSNAIIANTTSSGISLGTSGTTQVSGIIFNTPVAIAALGNNPIIYLSNCKINSTTFATFNVYREAVIYSSNHDQVAGANRIEMEGGTILSAVDQRHTASGISWKIQPTNSTTRNSLRPVILSLAKVACGASSLVTVKAWMRRDNTGLTMRLVCKGGQISGVTSDVVSAMTAAADTWEELTITFTPSVAGVVEITAEAWGGTTYSGWVDDMTISQA